MSIRSRRLLLLSSSALMALCFAGAAWSQTPATPSEAPPATTPPSSETPAPQAPQTTPPAPQPTPEKPPAVPGAAPLPQVTVEAPRRRPPRQAAPAAPARSTTPSAPRTTPPTTTPTAAQPTAAAASSVQPTPSLNTVTSNQIQATQAQSFGDLFFTKPGATSAGLAPGASRPVLRGLDDFRVRVQENGIGSMDVSDIGQDHGVPIDPLSIQKVEIYRGPEALRFGSQAVGGVVEATNNRIPFAAPLGGWQTQFKAATTTVDRGLEGGALFDAGTRDFAVHADFYGRRASDYFVPSYPYLFPTDPALPFNGKQRNSGLHSEGQRWAAPICSTAAISAPRSRASPASTAFPPWRGRRPTAASTSSRPSSPARASSARNPPPSTSCVSGSARSSITTTSSASTTPGSTAFARPSTTTPRRPRRKSPSCR